MKLIENQSLKNLNTFGVDVKAKYFAEVESEIELFELLNSSYFKENKYLILGAGSNVLFLNDYDGLIIKITDTILNVIDETPTEVIIECKAGAIWDDVVKFSVDNNFYGIENLSLIPGTIGAAPIQNIGAYGAELSNVLLDVQGISTSSLNQQELQVSDCKLSYRNSIFKNELRNSFIITSVKLRLSKTPKVNINYRDLKEKFNFRSFDNISLQEIRDAVINIRKNKLPDTQNLGNAGSFFKNPTINKNHLLKLNDKNKDLVFFKLDEDTFKIPAGWLIEKCGFKGKRIGNVGSYEKQALIIVNFGNASGREIQNFSDQIISLVDKQFGIILEPEVNFIS
ncbi:MAG: UDP-N-acetylmuramate dehydrogenase [Ignavibacteria bacterium]|nr:UDP-N-acetylmuramate dehydrogenase [Ignavibacteria bacterium]